VDRQIGRLLQRNARAAGLGRGVATVVKELARIKATTVILPTSTDREIELHCVTRADPWQQSLLDRLGLRLPRRLSQPRRRHLVET
jgi:hypothetical protein